MISVYTLKSRFQNILRPVCTFLVRKGITANQVTLSALISSILYGGLLWWGPPVFWLFLPVFLFLRMGLNAIDGMLAREHNMASKQGMALNELGDVLSDTALYLPFIAYAPQAAVAVLCFTGAALLTEFCGLLAYMIGAERRYDGPMGKSDRAVAIGTLGLLIGLGVPLQGHIGWMFIGLALACVWSCVNRLRAAIYT